MDATGRQPAARRPRPTRPAPDGDAHPPGVADRRVGDAVRLQVSATDSAQTLAGAPPGCPPPPVDSPASTRADQRHSEARWQKSKLHDQRSPTPRAAAGAGRVAWSVAGPPHDHRRAQDHPGPPVPPSRSAGRRPAASVDRHRPRPDPLRPLGAILSRRIAVRNSRGAQAESITRLRHGDLVVTLRTASVGKGSPADRRRRRSRSSRSRPPASAAARALHSLSDHSSTNATYAPPSSR